MKHVTYAIAALAALPQVGKGIPNFLSNFSAIRVLIDSYSCHTQKTFHFIAFLYHPDLYWAWLVAHLSEVHSIGK